MTEYFLPKLEEVGFEFSDMSARQFQQLIHCTRERKALGIPLKTIRFKRCSVAKITSAMREALDEEVDVEYPDELIS